MTWSDWAGIAAIAAVVGFLVYLYIWFINVKYDDEERRRR